VNRGALIAFEGIDGTGKGTQARLLIAALRRAGRRVRIFSFPAYGRTLSSSLVADYLNGRFGDLRPRLTALLFACDRLEQSAGIRQALDSGAFVVCDRYVPSNLAHQVAREPRAGKAALRRFILDLEYRRFGLPRPDAVLFLDMTPALARRRVMQKGRRQYTRLQLDIQESDRGHLAASLHEYREQATGRGWHRVSTIAEDGAPRSRGEIHADVLAVLHRSGVIPSIARRGSSRRPRTRR
jgi:dTMP kinase